MQGYGLSPECNGKCFFKIPVSEKALGHWLHRYDFSPECILKCLFKWSLWEKDVEHWLQGYDFYLSVFLNIVSNYNYHQRLEDIDCKDKA